MLQECRSIREKMSQECKSVKKKTIVVQECKSMKKNTMQECTKDLESAVEINKDIDILNLLIIKIIIVIPESNIVGGYKSEGKNNFCQWNGFFIIIVLVLLSLQKNFMCSQIFFDYGIAYFYLIESSQSLGLTLF